MEHLYQIENNMPKFIQRKFHIKRATVKPNEGGTSRFKTVIPWLQFHIFIHFSLLKYM